jgi:hypothetical protein
MIFQQRASKGKQVESTALIGKTRCVDDVKRTWCFPVLAMFFYRDFHLIELHLATIPACLTVSGARDPLKRKAEGADVRNNGAKDHVLRQGRSTSPHPFCELSLPGNHILRLVHCVACRHFQRRVRRQMRIRSAAAVSLEWVEAMM